MKGTIFKTPIHFAALIVAFVGSLCLTLPASAYYIDTGLSDPCHEKLTAELLVDFLKDYPSICDDIPLPDTHIWEMYADAIFANFDFAISNQSQKYFISSLLIGTRWPDEHGRSVTSLASLYDTHGDPNDQQEHFLRRLEHDYEPGNVQAIESAKQFLENQIQKALVHIQLPADSQIIPVVEYIEFYGQVTLQLWGPAYYLGTAIHALQDSFSHTVRSDDLSQILHVMNFLDAVTEQYDPHRDGLAHSYGMDECTQRNQPIMAAAQEATRDLMELFITPSSQVFDDVEANWLTYRKGCNLENKFCNSKWYDNVTTDPTEPIVGCHHSPIVPNNNFINFFISLFGFQVF